ncbi:RNA polymerase sigma factor [Chitinophaga sp.]|uniref:RNA polymerase sigma factor n=2 Tax=Chitinophaga TaxID=79328 RepID=UPI002FDE0E9C
MSEDIFQDEYHVLMEMAEGSEAAFAALHRRYWNDIYSLALSFLKSPEAAEDIVQEVFVKIWLRREALPEVQVFRPYVMVMVRNEIISTMRKDAVRQKRHDRFLADSGPQHTTHPGAPAAETARLIREALDQLPQKQREIFALSREEGLNHDMIAARTGLSRKTVSNTITIVLNHLRTALAKHGLGIWILAGIGLLFCYFKKM